MATSAAPPFTFNGLPLPPPYHESPLNALALLSATLLGIYATGVLFDHLCCAGLVAQLLAGALLGPPLLNIWSLDWLTTFRILGDLGLLLLVFSGGMAVDAQLLRKHLGPSVATALLGGMLPIVLAVVFFGACLQYPWIQAFTAGAALSSTSFGTTLVALAQADPSRSHPRGQQPTLSLQGDDEIGLDDDTESTCSETPSMIGPLRTRIGTVLVAAAMLDDVVGLLLLSIITALAKSPEATLSVFTFQTLGKPVLASIAILTFPPLVAVYLVRPAARCCVPWAIRRVSVNAVVYGLIAWMTLVLGGMVALSDLVGTTRMLGAFSAGLFVDLVGIPAPLKGIPHPLFSCLETVFNRSLGRVNNWLFLPLFFLSMGTPLPITHMFDWSILWQGLAFSILMFLGKSLVGPIILFLFISSKKSHQQRPRPLAPALSPLPSSLPATSTPEPPPYRSPPALFLGLGLVARGEVGIIMAQVAHASSLAMTWGDILETHLYLVAMWAILVCTVVGPIAFARFTHAHWSEIVEHETWGLAAAAGEDKEGQAAGEGVVGERDLLEGSGRDMAGKTNGEVVVHVDAESHGLTSQASDENASRASSRAGASAGGSSTSLDRMVVATPAIGLQGMRGNAPVEP